MMSWERQIADGLLEARRLGEREFARAWRYAERHASAPRPGGVRPPEDEGEDWLPFWAFFRRACRAEWEGRVEADYAGLPDLAGADDEDRAPAGSSRGMVLIA